MKYSVDKLIQEKEDYKKDDFLFFWGHRKGKKIGKTCFSQWYEIDFEVDGHKYNCAEQYMMSQKAWLFRDFETFAKILDATDPKEIKALGREVRNFDPKKWNEHKFEIVKKGNFSKFSQNQALKDFLLSSGHKIIVEASPYDTIWGIGMKDTAPGIENPSNWKGENLLGFALMEVRDQLRNEIENS